MYAEYYFCMTVILVLLHTAHADLSCYDITEKILPVVKKQHLLLCTLLICNAAAMEVNMLKLFHKLI